VTTKSILQAPQKSAGFFLLRPDGRAVQVSHETHEWLSGVTAAGTAIMIAQEWPVDDSFFAVNRQLRTDN
jgi:hypothetical protein